MQPVALPSLVASEHTDHAAGHLLSQPAKPFLKPPTSLIPENFECIDALVTLVEQLRLEGE